MFLYVGVSVSGDYAMEGIKQAYKNRMEGELSSSLLSTYLCFYLHVQCAQLGLV